MNCPLPQHELNLKNYEFDLIDIVMLSINFTSTYATTIAIRKYYSSNSYPCHRPKPQVGTGHSIPYHAEFQVATFHFVLAPTSIGKRPASSGALSTV